MKSNQDFSIEKTTETPKVYAYKYLWKTKDDKLCVKYVTDTQEGHAMFQKHLRDSDDVVSAMREYLHEINFAYLNFTEPVKEEKKNDENIQTS